MSHEKTGFFCCCFPWRIQKPNASLTEPMLTPLQKYGIDTVLKKTPINFYALQAIITDNNLYTEDLDGNGNTCLHIFAQHAAHAKHPDSIASYINVLAGDGADLNAKNRSGETPRDIALASGCSSKIRDALTPKEPKRVRFS